MSNIKVAILSDMHVGPLARSLDLRPAEVAADENGENFLARFEHFLAKRDLSADLLIVPGDATDRANPEEVQRAGEVIERACKALGVKKNALVFVPGNHDVDWAVLSLGPHSALRRHQRFDPLRAEGVLLHKVLGKARGNLLEEPHFGVWSGPEWIVVGYNSAWHDDPAQTNHHGLADRGHLDAMRQTLDQLNLGDMKLRVLVVHHHPLIYREPHPAARDMSTMQNAEEFIKIACDYGFDLLVHGHKHFPHFQTWAIDGQREIAILGAGSFSARLESQWAGTVANQFHIVEIEGKVPLSVCTVGRVKSWAFVPSRGWIESQEEYCGIAHEEPFGWYPTEDDLVDLLRELISQELRGKDHVYLETLYQTRNELRYVRPLRLKSALEIVSKHLSVDLIPSAQDSYLLLRP